jgi:hypothetical protein
MRAAWPAWRTWLRETHGPIISRLLGHAAALVPAATRAPQNPVPYGPESTQKISIRIMNTVTQTICIRNSIQTMHIITLPT